MNCSANVRVFVDGPALARQTGRLRTLREGISSGLNISVEGRLEFDSALIGNLQRDLLN
jgi:hypothetical protein